MLFDNRVGTIPRAEKPVLGIKKLDKNGRGDRT
jgi:hypothetical protein